MGIKLKFSQFTASTTAQMALNQPSALLTPKQQPQQTMSTLPDSQLFTTSNARIVQQSFSEQLGICEPTINQVKSFLIGEPF